MPSRNGSFRPDFSSFPVVVRVPIQGNGAGLLVRARLDHERTAAGGLGLDIHVLFVRLARRNAAAQRTPNRIERIRVRALGLHREGVAAGEGRVDPRFGELAEDRTLLRANPFDPLLRVQRVHVALGDAHAVRRDLDAGPDLEDVGRLVRLLERLRQVIEDEFRVDVGPADQRVVELRHNAGRVADRRDGVDGSPGPLDDALVSPARLRRARIGRCGRGGPGRRLAVCTESCPRPPPPQAAASARPDAPAPIAASMRRREMRSRSKRYQ